MFRKFANSSILRVFGEYLFASTCLIAEIFSSDTSDNKSTKNVNKRMRERARKIFDNTEKVPFSPISMQLRYNFFISDTLNSAII